MIKIYQTVWNIAKAKFRLKFIALNVYRKMNKDLKR